MNHSSNMARLTQHDRLAEHTCDRRMVSGSTTANVDPQLMTPARRFGGVRFFMGFQQGGTFFVKDIIVTRTP